LDNDVSLEVEGLWKTYGKTIAHALISHSGAGKTTTVKCVVGLLNSDKGETTVMGRNIRNDYGF
jgi:ABC-type multidrug transport system ATPase subunit